MAFVRRRRRKGGGFYRSLEERYRDENGRVRTRWLKNLGIEHPMFGPSASDGTALTEEELIWRGMAQPYDASKEQPLYFDKDGSVHMSHRVFDTVREGQEQEASPIADLFQETAQAAQNMIDAVTSDPAATDTSTTDSTKESSND